MKSLRLSFLLLFAALCSCIHAADTSGRKNAEQSAELSPFEVRVDKLQFNKWTKVRSPHFTLYTDTKTKEAVEIVRQMEMLQMAAQAFLKRKILKRGPTVVILPTKRSDWKKLQSKGAVAWEVACSSVGGDFTMTIVQYDWQDSGLDTVWSSLGSLNVSRMNLDGPLWFWRGISHFFVSAEFKGDNLTLGKETPLSSYLRGDKWLPWARFFQVNSRSKEFTDDNEVHHSYEGQAAVFVHYVLTNPDPTWVPRLLAWASYLDAGNKPTEEAFKQNFGISWKEMQDNIYKMLTGGTYATRNIAFPPAALQFSIVPSVPSDREMKDLFVISQILNQSTPDSVKSLDALIARGNVVEPFREHLAAACFAHDRREEGLRQLKAIIDAGSDNPAVFRSAAETLFDDEVKETGVDARVTANAPQIKEWCARAIELEPFDVDANSVLAWTEALGETVTAENIATIVKICKTLDGNAPTDRALAALAVARFRAGNLKQARSLTDRLLSSPYAGRHEKEIARDVAERIAATPAPIAQPVPAATP